MEVALNVAAGAVGIVLLLALAVMVFSSRGLAPDYRNGREEPDSCSIDLRREMNGTGWPLIPAPAWPALDRRRAGQDCGAARERNAARQSEAKAERE